MRKNYWHKMALVLMSGTILLQLPSCTDTAIYVSSVAQVVTAGGVLFLIRKVLS